MQSIEPNVVSGAGDLRPLAELVRAACLEAALAAYEDAQVRGLCREGAWEVAMDAVRELDMAILADKFLGHGGW